MDNQKNTERLTNLNLSDKDVTEAAANVEKEPVVQMNGQGDSFDDGSSDESDEQLESSDPAVVSEDIVVCLECEEECADCDICIAHMKESHNFDLLNYCKRIEIDHLGFIKFINFTRRHKGKLVGGLDTIGSDLSDENFAPVVENDAFLRYDIEGPMGDENRGPPTYEELEEKNADLTKSLIMMQAMVKRLVDEDSTPVNRSLLQRTQDDDASYKDSYSDFGIHHEMLSDKVRTLAYRDALSNNSSIMEGAKVLDLGAGTGILSMFAAKAGAKSVLAVDMADIADSAKLIIRANKLDHIITVHKGRLEQLDLSADEDKFDVIVSEWMGYFLLFEGMIDSVLLARDRYLKPGGVMMPNQATMFICAIDCQEVKEKFIGFWADQYGFDMRAISEQTLDKVPCVSCHSGQVATDSAQILSLDMATIQPSDTNFRTPFKLVPSRTTSLTAVCGYFHTQFALPNPVGLSTSPHDPATHWKQMLFFLEHELPVERDIPIEGVIEVSRQSCDVRALQVEIKLCGRKSRYFIE